MRIMQSTVIVLAAFSAGVLNSIAGGGTLISFPTLVWLGRDPIFANATSTVALWPGSLAGAVGFRKELTGSRRWALILAPPSFIGGALGAFLLLQTPSQTFARIVPFLILAATLLRALQEPLARRLGRLHETSERRQRASLSVLILFQFLVAVYGGYFGAGIGILMLAALGLMGLTDIHQMNGLKNLLALCINGIAALYFVLSGTILWGDAIWMTAGAVAGGFSGASLARKLGRRFVGYAVIAIGLVMAASLFVLQ